MNQDFLKSLIFHLIIAILLVVSTWSIFARKVEPLNETPITVTLAPMGEKTNIKPAPKQETKPPKPQKSEPKTEPKPEPKKPEPKKPEPKKVEPKKPEPKKPEKKKDELDQMLEKMDKPDKKDKQDPDKLAELLKDLDTKKAPEKSSNEAVTNKDSKTDQKFDENSPEALAEQDYINKLIIDQIKVCWSPPAGGRDAKNLVVRADIDIALDGTIKFVGFNGAQSGDPVYQAAMDAAKRAILDPECNPLRQKLPADKYELWKEKTVRFDPKELAN